MSFEEKMEITSLASKRGTWKIASTRR